MWGNLAKGIERRSWVSRDGTCVGNSCKHCLNIHVMNVGAREEILVDLNRSTRVCCYAVWSDPLQRIDGPVVPGCHYSCPGGVLPPAGVMRGCGRTGRVAC